MRPHSTGRALVSASSKFVLLLAVLIAGAGVNPAPVAATDVAGDVKRTRFVIGLDRTVKFHVTALTAPNRVVVELPEVGMQLPSVPEGRTIGLVKDVRGGLSAPGRSRVVIDVASPVVVESQTLEKAKDGKGHRLVLEIVPFEEKSRKVHKVGAGASALGASGVEPPSGFTTTVWAQPPVPRRAEAPKAKAARAYKPTIVIDPGHGGHDSGAQKFGASEKDIVLAFSKVLRDKLVATGRYHVLMTRESDVFVDLDDRVEFGEKSKAALFIAVHADYANANARGATIYSLREGMAEDLKRSAKAEVAQKAMSDKDFAAVRHESAGDADLVKNILADLAQREVDVNKERTSIFTRSVIEYMGQSTSLMDTPDRSAGFRVLKTAQFPSVLIELGFVTNRQDAQLLQSDSWRQKVSGSIATAVENYFSNQLARLPM